MRTSMGAHNDAHADTAVCAPSFELPETPHASEVHGLVQEMGRAYVNAVQFYRTHLGKSLDEADQTLRDFTTYDSEQVPVAPADQISWLGLGRLMEHEPELGQRVWDRIKDDARAQLDSG